MKRKSSYSQGPQYKKMKKTYKKPATKGAVGEMKYYDTELTATALVASTDWTGTEFDPSTTNEASPVATTLTLFAPKQGSNINQRVGKKCHLHRIKIRGVINCPAQANQTAGDEGLFIRMSLVQDTQTNITQAQGEQIFTDPTTNSSLNAISSFINVDTLGRFRVLKEKYIQWQQTQMTYDGTNIEQSGSMRMFKIGHNFKIPQEVHFNATNGGTVADIVNNSFHLIVNASNISLAPFISYYCRCYYKDV